MRSSLGILESPGLEGFDTLGGAARVWVASNDNAGRLAELIDLLSEDERARGTRIVDLESRRQYLAAHVLLRLVVGELLRIPAGELRFAASPRGKPFLTPPSTVEFSLAHSRQWAVVAVSSAGRVGVDVEELRTIPEALSIANRMFSAAAAHRVRSAAPADRPAVFLGEWTRLEAIAKTTGAGIVEGDADDTGIRVEPFVPGNDAIGAVAVEVRDPTSRPSPARA